MQKTILITGSTDGIGLETAKTLAALGHRVLLHGRNPAKLDAAAGAVGDVPEAGPLGKYVADLSRIEDVEALAEAVVKDSGGLDVLINNAGVYNAADPMTKDGLDVRFVVNTIAPYLLTQRLLPLLGTSGRVVNLSSAAQASVDLRALAGDVNLADGTAYAQSKLAITMWSRHLAQALGDSGPVILAVNPGSLLATKMVKQAFGVAGGDVRRGAEVLRSASLDDAFAAASGKYFDNDSGRFANPHPDALDPSKCEGVVLAIEAILKRLRK
ncbi:MAG: SDR family NAD(P)-dependent oxidoreductase [Acidobacteriota bacterium]